MKFCKKLVTLLLAALLTIGLASPAFAATVKITDASRAINYLVNYNLSDLVFQDIPGDKTLVYPLSAGMFTWSDGVKRADTEPVTQAQFSDAAITLRVADMPADTFEYIRLETRAHAKTGNKRTMCVVVKFPDEFVSTKEAVFNVTVQLLRNRSRMQSSTMELDGVLYNRVKTIAPGNDFVSIERGEVLEPTGTIPNLEIDLGNGVIVKTNVYSNRRYYGVTSTEITEADDEVLRRFSNSLDSIVTIKSIGLSGLAGRPVTLEGYSGLHIYDAKGTYLGNGRNALPFSTKYYCFTRQVDLTGVKLGGTVSTGGTASSTSSTSSPSSSSTAPGTTLTPSTSGKAYDSTSISSLASSAVTAAKNAKSTVATVKVQNPQSITIGGLQQISRTAANAGLSSSFVADTVAGGRVAGRMTITPKLAANLPSTAIVKLGVYVDSASIKTTQSRFDAWFKNNKAYIAMQHQGNLGMTVNIAAYVNLSGLNTSRLRFYCYTPSTNTYREITTSYRIDGSGYLHFTTSYGGDYVITDAPLTK